jgi:hypothetical protein
MPDSLTTKMQKQAIREEILHRWDVKIPAARAAKLSLKQLVAIRKALIGGTD